MSSSSSSLSLSSLSSSLSFSKKLANPYSNSNSNSNNSNNTATIRSTNNAVASPTDSPSSIHMTSTVLDPVHQALTRVLHHASPDTMSRFQTVLHNHMRTTATTTCSEDGRSPWTLRCAELLAKRVVLVAVAVGGVSEEPAEQQPLLRLLVQAVPQWDSVVLYAVVATTHELVPTLMRFVLQLDAAGAPTGDAIDMGFMALAYIWETLERLQRQHLGRIDTAWWYRGDDQPLHELALVAVQRLLQRSDLIDATAQTAALDAQASCASFLVGLLQHDVNDWIYQLDRSSSKNNSKNNTLTPLLHQLLEDTQPLEHDNKNTDASTIRLALSAVSLLCMLLVKHDIPQLNNFAPSGTLVDHVSKVAFSVSYNNSNSNRNPVGSPTRGPCWTHEPVASAVRQQAQQLVSIWSLSQPQEQLSRQYWLPCVEAAWRAILESNLTSEQPLSCLLLVLLSFDHRLGARRCLSSILVPTSSSASSQSTFDTMVEGCRVLIASLLNHCQHTNLMLATSSAALLGNLLRDRQEVATHDELSRALWSAMSLIPLARLVDGTIKLASSSHACQPLLLCMMDTVELLLCYAEADKSSSLLLDLGTARIESLIQIMSKSNAPLTTDASNSDRSVMEDTDDETPPVSNLSRCSDRALHGSPTTTESMDPGGYDHSIRLGAATILAHMGYPSAASDDDKARRLKQRVQSALYDYVAGLGTATRTCLEVSYSNTRRSVRLYSLLALQSKENETLIASVLTGKDQIRRKELQNRTQDLEDYQRQLEQAQKETLAIAVEKEQYKVALRSQAVVLERDWNRRQKHATAAADQLAEVHAAERAKAEAQLGDALSRTNEAESMVLDLQRQVETSRATEQRTKGGLHEATVKLESIQRELEEARALEQARLEESERLERELAAVRGEMQDLKTRNNSSQSELVDTRLSLSDMKHAYVQLQDELEVVFSNLSALAQVYEAKEGEVATIVEQKDRAVQEARRQSDEEIQRNEQLAEKHTRLELENDRLKKKLIRAKEKLEVERQARRDEEARRKRSGPVSYLNSLTDRTSGSSENVGRSERALVGKENSRSTSTSSS